MTDKHNCGCGCGCGDNGCGDNGCHDDDFEIMTLTMEDGTEVECAIIGIFPVDEKEYIALIPVEELESEDGEVYLYQVEEDENGELDLIEIESDDEYERVSAEFDQIMEEEFGDDDDCDCDGGCGCGCDCE